MCPPIYAYLRGSCNGFAASPPGGRVGGARLGPRQRVQRVCGLGSRSGLQVTRTRIKWIRASNTQITYKQDVL